MLYQKYLKEKHPCPFCNLTQKEILKQNKYAILTFAKAPYTEHHLLVVPKKHHSKLNSMTPREKKAIDELIYFGMKKLNKKHRNVTILYREGISNEVGKSVSHLHYHLIPNLLIGAYDINYNKRKIYSEEEYVKKIGEIKKELF